MKKTVVIGVSGGIAAFKILKLINILKKENINVIVMMTYGASKIINPQEFEKATGNKVLTDVFAENIDRQKILKNRKVDHIELAKTAHLMVIAPATANVVAKIANGIADDYVTTTVLAARSPVVICPSMNTYMWTNPATQKNIDKLKSEGYIILDPDSGLLACGDEGTGRLVDPKEIAKEILNLVKKLDSLNGKKVIVTSGGTHEYIDSVRFIANKSSGKTGVSVAEAAYLRGADVLFVRSISSLKPRYPVSEITYETAGQLGKILKKHIPDYDICFHAAAVSDFTVKENYSGKLTSDREMTLILVPQEKILNKLKKYNPKIFLVAWKAVWSVSESELIAAAKKKLNESDADIVVANDIGKKDQGFSVDTNEVILVGKNEVLKKIPFASKKIIGEKIIDFIINCLIKK